MRTLGKLAKGAVHSLERDLAPVLTGGFLMITGELGILMCGFTFLSAMQFLAGKRVGCLGCAFSNTLEQEQLAFCGADTCCFGCNSVGGMK